MNQPPLHPWRDIVALTARKSVRPLPSHRLALSSVYSLSGHASPDTTDADSSTPPRFVHPSLARTPQCSEAYLRWRSAPLSTMYPSTTSESSARDSTSESFAGPSRKRCRSHATRFRDSISPEDSVEEDNDTKVLEDIEADATVVEVAVDRYVEVEVDTGIDMEVDIEVVVEDGVEDEVESSDREDTETGQRELEARSLIVGGERASLLDQVASLERSNARIQGTVMMERARADRFSRRVRFIESELRQKSVVNITNSSTNKAFQVPVDPFRLQSPFNSRYGLFTPCHILLSPESCIYTWIEPLDLEFLDSISQCFQNPCQRAVTELVCFVEPHDHSFIVVDREHYCSRRLSDGIIMLELIACRILSWFSEVLLCLNQEDDRNDLAEGAYSGLQNHWDIGFNSDDIENPHM
uniref:Uncharacterized protein n=1 Tax=Tanacetum cinerariifolium TaxID=118510 RepID=A0A6L2K9T6_TANCI|nr:hypothetical protein [Tanacetum cinerariifolium]